MTKIVLEDCFEAVVKIKTISSKGLRCHILDATPCYPNQRIVYISDELNLSWEKDNWYIEECDIPEFEEIKECLDGFTENPSDKQITKAFAIYLAKLEKMEEDENSDNPRIWFYRNTKDDCLFEAILEAVA